MSKDNKKYHLLVGVDWAEPNKDNIGKAEDIEIKGNDLVDLLTNMKKAVYGNVPYGIGCNEKGETEQWCHK